GVLPLLADCQRELAVRHHRLRGQTVLQDAHALHLRRAQRVGDEGGRIGVPLHHVTAITVELIDDVLDADAQQTNTGADRVDALLARVHGHLAAEAGLPGNSLDFDGASEDLRHLQLEQAAQEVAVRSRYGHLRSTVRLLDLQEVYLQALAGPVVLRADLLRGQQHRLGLAEVDVDVPALQAVDDAGDDVALLAGVLLEHDLALGL